MSRRSAVWSPRRSTWRPSTTITSCGSTAAALLQTRSDERLSCRVGQELRWSDRRYGRGAEVLLIAGDDPGAACRFCGAGNDGVFEIRHLEAPCPPELGSS